MNNKYQIALDLVKPNSRLDYDYLEDCSDKEEIIKAYDTLQSLINKWTELGCELSNLPFFDDECKLKTIEFIERIYYDK